MRNYYLYVHITPSNKLYIGITTNCIGRWKNGYGYGSSPHFYNAILKYGWDNIQHIVLLEGLSKEVACECEKYLIAKYQTTNPKYGYNVCAGGEGTNGYHHTEEYKENLRNRPISKEQRKAISNTVKKRWKEGRFIHTGDNWRQGAWNKGLTKNDLRVAKYCRKKGEWKMPDDARKKLSNSKKGLPAHNRKKVLCVETGLIYDSVISAQAITGINNISLAARNENRTAGKLHWRYI